MYFAPGFQIHQTASTPPKSTKFGYGAIKYDVAAFIG